MRAQLSERREAKLYVRIYSAECSKIVEENYRAVYEAEEWV